MKTFSIPDQKPVNDLRFGRLVKDYFEAQEKRFNQFKAQLTLF